MPEPEGPLTFPDRAAWRAWLEAHHAEAKEAWLILYKKGTRPDSLTYEEAVEEALCLGWIDGTLRSLDEERFLLRYTPRRRNSVWSKSNRLRVEKLIREGRMAPAGLEKVGQAQASGQWEAAVLREDASDIPSDLEEALGEREGAREAFDRLPPSHQKQYLGWIAEAKRPQTRQRRIEATVEAVLKHLRG